MTDTDLEIIVFVLLAVAIGVYVCVSSSIKRKKAAENAIKKAWGKRVVYKGTDESFEYISHYAKGNPSESMIDDITWNDLGMDEVFKCINNTNSSVGQEYLYKMLREPVADAEKLHELDRLADEFTANEKERITIQKIFMNMGKSRKIAVTDYIGYIMDIEQGSNIVHYLAWVFLIASILVTVLVTPVLGIWLIIASVAFSIITYYKYKAKIENYFKCINVIVKMASASEDICESNISFLEPECNRLKEILKSFSKVTKGSWMIESGNVDGSIGEVVLDYLRMITHMDIVKFNKMTKLITAKSEDAYNLVDTLGFIETSIAVASFRESLPFYCKPEFVENTNNLSVKEVYHPLIDNPVCNSITTKGNVLLTGSNASGKSTFLKTLNRMNDLVDGVRIDGNVLLDGEDIYDPSVDTTILRKKVGMVFQQPNPFPMSIYDNIAYGPRVHGIRDKKRLDQIVEESLRGAAIFDEVKDRLKKSAMGLSGGQQQRICIARALAVQPEVLLMDEPTSALDPISTAKIEELMEDLKKKYTVIVVTHNMQQATRVSDQTAFFLVGEMVEFGDTKQIFSYPQDKRTEDYITGRFG